MKRPHWVPFVIEHRNTPDIKDPEIAAMHALGTALGQLRKLSADERYRVLAWAKTKLTFSITSTDLDALDRVTGGQYL